jgi:hypothetical protein
LENGSREKIKESERREISLGRTKIKRCEEGQNIRREQKEMKGRRK